MASWWRLVTGSPADAAAPSRACSTWLTASGRGRRGVRSSYSPTVRPVMSATAARIRVGVTSRAATWAASGLTAYSWARGPGPPWVLPLVITRPASSSRVSSWAVVGLESPVSSPSWVRDSGPCSRSRSRAARSLMPRSRRGVPGFTGSRHGSADARGGAGGAGPRPRGSRRRSCRAPARRSARRARRRRSGCPWPSKAVRWRAADVQWRIPVWKPPRPPSKLPFPLGPLTTAPTSSGGLPSRLPAQVGDLVLHAVRERVARRRPSRSRPTGRRRAARCAARWRSAGSGRCG